jgi:SMI1-KNR4 cell-wall
MTAWRGDSWRNTKSSPTSWISVRLSSWRRPSGRSACVSPHLPDLLSELGAGDIVGAEFYGVIDDDFQNSGIPDGIWLTLKKRKDAELPESLVIVADAGYGPYLAIDTSRVDDAGESPVVMWMPGAPDQQDPSKLETVAADFGELFRRDIEAGLGQGQPRSDR